jgi:1-acyl-sn-glycerol-3-phosphate acyltransferase
VSFIDWLILYGSIQRPVRFVMDHQIYHTPGFGKLLHDAKVIPIASRKEDPVVLEAAMDRIAEELEQGELVCIFPEGMITRTGEMGMFKHGVEQIVSRTPVPVVPMALRGLWGSFFSRKYGRAMTRPFRRFWSRIAVICGPPVVPDAVEADRLHDTVLALRGEQV